MVTTSGGTTPSEAVLSYSGLTFKLVITSQATSTGSLNIIASQVEVHTLTSGFSKGKLELAIQSSTDILAMEEAGDSLVGNQRQQEWSS